MSAESIAELAGHTHYHGLAYSRSSAALLLATHHGIYAVDEQGNATRVSPIHDYMGFTPDPEQPLRFIGSGHPAQGGNSGVIESRDGGATWSALSSGADGLGQADFHAMAAGTPGVFYGAFKGIQTSTDSGKTWTLTGVLPEKLIGLAGSPSVSGRLYAATGQGLLRSDDQGKTWQVVAFGGEIVSAVTISKDCRIVANVVGKGIVASSESGTDKWEALSGGFAQSIPLYIALNQNDPARIAFASQDSELFESRDGGKTWAPVGN